MLKQLFPIATLALFFCLPLHAQNDPTLFMVGSNSVPVSEFKYIYTKTNQEKADFSEQSLRDYLNLYVNFKLKVAKARDMRLDTIGTLQTELDGYRRQLAKSYLEDKEVTERLVRETYDRMQQDVDISYIFVACDRNAKAADSLRAYNRAQRILKAVQSGIPFEKVAMDSSEEKSVKENQGRLGFMNAMLPEGYYNLEKAAYAAKPGEVVGPIRSNNGYSVIKVHGFRPARGEMEIAQILVRKGEAAGGSEKAKMRIDSVYAQLLAGDKWEELCTRYSDDKMTVPKGGYLGFFGINRYQRPFEDAAFGIAKDGEYSKPVETTIGWHIIKRISARPVGAYEALKKGLTDRVKRDSRSEIARRSMIAQIKKTGGAVESPEVLDKWKTRQVDSVFHTFRWKPDPAKPQDVLLRYNTNKNYTVADFEEYCGKASQERMRGAGLPIEETIQKLYRQWSDDVAMQYEESQLDTKYPEFRSLMREYSEGILLFEALKINVWDRANTDTMGLEKFFATKIKDKYKWDERARTTLYTLKTDDPKVLANLRDLAKKKNAADVLKKMNKKEELVTVIEKTYEKGKNKDLNDIWKAGSMTAAKTDSGTKTATFLKIEEIQPPTPKALSEARGYAVADYQDYLEKQWIEDLKKQFPVKIDESALKSLVKK
jgi:peptidyl-prolyl cis-trans isomerase SurA